MAQFGKSVSSKRGKPSYAMAIIGVALVLFLFGIVGWLFLNLKKSGEMFRENIQVHAWLMPSAGKKQVQKQVNTKRNNFIKSILVLKSTKQKNKDVTFHKKDTCNLTRRRAPALCLLCY